MRNIRRGIFVAQITAVLSLLTVISVLAAAMAVRGISFTNKIATGSVDIMIRQYEKCADGMRQVQPGAVLAGEDISYIPEVTNLRADSYIRVKADILMDKEVPEPLTADRLHGIGEDWIKRGEFFYCTRPLKHLDSEYLCTGIQVPESWDEDTSSGFRAKLTADAMQAKDFVPDFDAPDPWGSISVQKARIANGTEYRTARQFRQEGHLRIKEGMELESNTEDLFGNFDDFMAGSVYEDCLTIENISKRPVKISFCTETEQSPLLEAATLEIRCGGKLLYTGDLVTASLHCYTGILELQPGEKGKVEFRVELPYRADNDYSLLRNQVIWKFRVEGTEDDTGSAKTGDDSDLCIALLAALGAAVLMMILAAAGKKGERK